MEIDYKSKWLELDGDTGGDSEAPAIILGAGERSLHLHKDRSGCTVVEFPDFVGWTVFTAVAGRYTISVCLIKN